MQRSTIFGAGSNFFGQLGLGQKERSKTERDLCLFGASEEATIGSDQVSDIQCGSQFTVVLDKVGNLNICGTLNGTVFPTLSPLEIPLPIKCIQVACGRRHILLLMERNIVMSWGTGYFGQLGHGDDSSWDSPRMIGGLDPKRLGSRVTSIACGGSHSAAITDSGRVFMWGLNRGGQCGQGASAKGKSDSILEPRPVDFSHLNTHGPVVVKSLTLGRNHSAMLSTTGRVFVWGEAGYGRLGLNDVKKTQLSPAEVVAFRTNPVAVLSSGDFHMVALTQDGHVFSWGYGVDGQTGHSTMLNVRCPRRIDFFDSLMVRDICCGATYTLVLTMDGCLYSFGYGDGHWLMLTPTHELPQVEIDSLTPALAASLPESHAEICCFDSRYTVLRPRLVESLRDYVVKTVRAGAGHTIAVCSRRDESTASNLHRGASFIGTDPSSSAGTAGPGNSSGGVGGSGLTGSFGVPPLAPAKANSFNSNTLSGAKNSAPVTSKYDSKAQPHTTPLSAAHNPNLDYSGDNNTESSKSNSNSNNSLNSAYNTGTNNSNNSNSKHTLYPHLNHPSHPSFRANVALKTQSQSPKSDAKPSSELDPGSPHSSAQVFSWVRHKKITELSGYLAEGLNPNVVDAAGNTPIIVACQNGHHSVVKLFLSNGADINAGNHKGNTALHYCMNYGYEDIGNFLIENGADDFQTNAEGLTCYEGLTQSDLELL